MPEACQSQRHDTQCRPSWPH